MTGPNEPLLLWNVPYLRNPYFTGREDVLNQLYRILHTENVVALSHPQGISGLGGIGKTQLALEYAYRYSAEYHAVLWVRADSMAALTSSFVELARVLELPEHHKQDQEIIVQAVLRWLRLHTRWLLIYDNIEDIATIELFLPKAGSGHIIFTTRAHTFGAIAQRLGMERMEPDTGALLLLRRASLLPLQASLDQASEDDLHFARLIAQELDGLPIALDQAGAYIKETPCSLPEYLVLYQTRRADVLRIRGSLDQDYPASVATTWSLSLEKIAQANPASAELLNLCAYLHPEAIPEEILTIGSPYFGEPLASVAGDPLQFNLAIVQALKFSLIARNADDQTLKMHRLVQAAIRDTLPFETGTIWKHRIIGAVNAAFPNATFEHWAACERLLSQALLCTTWVEEEQITTPEAARLLNEAGSYLDARACYVEAEPLLKQALAIRMQPGGASYPDTAISLNNLAILYRNRGKYTDAEPLLQRAISICEQQLGPQHPITARSLNNLAILYQDQSKYEQAEPLLVRALAIREQQLGAVHPDTATSLNDLALLYENQGKLEKAEPLYRQALAIREQQLGPDHPSTVQSLDNLGKLYQNQGKDIETELLLRRTQIPETQQQLEPAYSSVASSSNTPSPGGRGSGDHHTTTEHFDRSTSDLLSPASSKQQRTARSGAPFPAIWNVPRRHVAYFTGRDHVLQQLFDGFRQEKKGETVSPQALIGGGGIGKTQAVAEYAYRFREQYRAVLWVRAETREDLMADFKAIAGLLNFPQDCLQDQTRLMQTIQEWFQNHSDWLLIFDNADDPELVASFLPRTVRGHVLLTARSTDLQPLARLFILDPLKPEDGALCILRRVGSVSSQGQLSDTPAFSAQAARTLSQLMNGLPLALEQAGAYIEDTGSSVSRYLAIFEQYRSEIQQRHHGTVPDYLESVASAWKISRGLIEQTDPAAAELLRLCAFLPPDVIPHEIFTSGANLGPILTPVATHPLALERTITLLARHSLIQRAVDRETDTPILSINRGLQKFLQDDMDQPTKNLWAERAAYLLPVDVTRVQIEMGRGSVMIVEEGEDLILHVTNSTRRPMGKIDIELTPSAEYDHLTANRVSIPWLHPQGSTDVCFRLRMKVARRVSINYLVNGVLGNTPFSVYASRNNPYIYGPPVDEGVFLGRQEEIETIVQAVTKPAKQDILVVGERRSGKTSLLYQLGKRLNKPFIAIYMVLNMCRPRTDDVLAHVLHNIIWALVERGILDSAWHTHEFTSSDFTERIDEVIQEARRTVENPRLILLLDEADFLLAVKEESFSFIPRRGERKGRYQVDERVQRVLRAALQSPKIGSYLRAVVAGTSDLSTYMLQHSSPFFNHFRFVHLKPLSPEETRELIVKPAEMLGVTFSPNAIERISSFSGRQPFYCQALCYEALAHAQWLNNRIIDEREVDVAEQKISDGLFPAFVSGIWRRATRKERAILAALVRREPSLSATNGNLQRLLEWQIVIRDQERYCFAAGLFEQWTMKALKER